MRHPIPRYSFLAFQVNGLLDKGLSIPIDEAHERIADGSILDWLEDEFAKSHSFDISLYEPGERGKIIAAFSSLSNAVDARGKLAVEHNGLALLVAYCIEIMQHPDGFED